MRKITIAILCLLMLMPVGCGRKGPLVRPEALIPAQVADLHATQTADRLRLSWSLPDRLDGGGKLTDLAGFKLMRREVSKSGNDCMECPDSWKLVRQINLEYLQGVNRVGNRLFYQDNDADEGMTYLYRVIATTKSGLESRPSQVIKRTRRAPLAPPTIKATPSPTAIGLECSGSSLPPEAKGAECVFLRQKGENASTITLVSRAPINSRIEDTGLESGTTYTYTAAVNATVDGNPMESSLSAPITARLAEPE
jgi:predicted small lipoprotein YifL